MFYRYQVTSDHAHTMTMSGYSSRGNNVLGLNTEISDMDQKPYTTLNYANGPGYKESSGPTSGRYNLANDTFCEYINRNGQFHLFKANHLTIGLGRDRQTIK